MKAEKNQAQQAPAPMQGEDMRTVGEIIHSLTVFDEADRNRILRTIAAFYGGEYRA